MEDADALKAASLMMNLGYKFQDAAETAPIRGTWGQLTTRELGKPFETIARQLFEKNYAMVDAYLRAAVRGWEGHGYGLDRLRQAVTIYADALGGDGVTEMITHELIEAVNEVVDKAQQIARHSS